MKYKVGDKVLIKNIIWYDKNKDSIIGNVRCGCNVFTPDMTLWCAKVLTITSIHSYGYNMLEDRGRWGWTDGMIECKIE